MLLLLLAPLALAAEPHVVGLVGGLGVASAPPSLGGHGVGRVVFRPGPRLGLEAGGREGVYTRELRTVGAVVVGGRLALGEGAFARLAFAHHHETGWDDFKARPLAALAGTLPDIHHRTGLEAGLGFGVGAPGTPLGDRLRFGLELAVTILPDRQGPPVYVILEQTWEVGLGKPPGAR